ncbi:signal peptide peptidase SppA, 67K type [Hoylesella pleuritidis F0068]|uniref:Signal peptide peptidase SppA, 67K type n=2 Tax=Hoylesella pleuritidis TaxID=407975 RepID=U2MPI5_9BACT|nr:signal peptide peptidase SppA, 67K type [Hoylesella pleuritidis F0068]
MRLYRMKDFFKHTLATIAGLFIFSIIVIIIGVMSLVGMVSAGEATKTVADKSVLVLNLSGELQEQSEDNVFQQFAGTPFGNLGLEKILSAIKKAKNNDKIKGIYIEAGALGADFASLQEIRNALLDFKKSHKWIIAYADTYTQGTYYVASAANEIYLNPQGMITWHGLSAQPIFIKDLLAKVGIRMQVLKVGKYKSATEMFTGDKMSDANREQTTAYLTSLWSNVCKAVSESRKISIDSLNTYADRLVMFEDARQLVKYKMVDGLLYTDQIKKKIKQLLHIDDDKDINQISIADMSGVKEKLKGKEIAVYYAYGDIVDSPITGGLLGSKHQIVAQDVCKDLADLMEDDDVKAVVIRINTGGGSAYASEQLWHQIEMLKRKKPVVVSMGGVTASGGYYMSCNANWIVAQPTTITGSIGIFGIVPDRSQLLTQKLGIKFDEVKTNRNATFGTSARPMNAAELGYMQAYIDRGYKLFRRRVADGRHLSTAQVEQVAQGHVFTGEAAKQLKLIDQLGGIDAAVAKAAQLAKLSEYHTYTYPAPTDWFEQLFNTFGGGNYLDGKMRTALGDYYEPVILLKQMNQLDALQARIPFFLNIK